MVSVLSFYACPKLRRTRCLSCSLYANTRHRVFGSARVPSSRGRGVTVPLTAAYGRRDSMPRPSHSAPQHHSIPLRSTQIRQTHAGRHGRVPRLGWRVRADPPCPQRLRLVSVSRHPTRTAGMAGCGSGRSVVARAAHSHTCIAHSHTRTSPPSLVHIGPSARLIDSPPRLTSRPRGPSIRAGRLRLPARPPPPLTPASKASSRTCPRPLASSRATSSSSPKMGASSSRRCSRSCGSAEATAAGPR